MVNFLVCIDGISPLVNVMKELEQLNYCLGHEVKYLPNKFILMTQTKYIKHLLHETNMIEAHSISLLVYKYAINLKTTCTSIQLIY